MPPSPLRTSSIPHPLQQAQTAKAQLAAAVAKQAKEKERKEEEADQANEFDKHGRSPRQVERPPLQPGLRRAQPPCGATQPPRALG